MKMSKLPLIVEKLDPSCVQDHVFLGNSVQWFLLQLILLTDKQNDNNTGSIANTFYLVW